MIPKSVSEVFEIDDEKKLKEIAEMDGADLKIRKTAIWLIKDEEFLKKIALMNEKISEAAAHGISNQDFLVDIFYSDVNLEIKYEALMNMDDEHLLEMSENTDDDLILEIISREYESRHWCDVQVMGLS